MLMADPENRITTMILRSGIDYCYIIPRLDGTVIVGGIKEPGDMQVSSVFQHPSDTYIHLQGPKSQT